MPGGSRSLPGRPSLRHLKLEAKRRLAAGEFSSLHDAQVALAWEHGLPSWTSLKQLVCAQAGEESHALDQLRWVIARFARADEAGWVAPTADELGQHFHERFLAAVPPPALIATISKLTKDLRDGELVVLGRTPLQAYIQLGSLQYVAAVEPDPPNRLTGLQGLPIGSRVHDPRVANPPVRTHGNPPAGVPEIAEQAVAELGMAALLLAGGDPGGNHSGGSGGDAGTPPWVLTRGWADLDRGEPLDPAHRFQAPGVTVLVTATAVLRLVADGELSLDRRANEYLRTMSLADDTITVRELLSHTAGVDNPTELYADTVPDLAEFIGPVVACTGPRGTVHPSNGGAAVLGQLVADVTGMPYERAAAELILKPLGMHDSSFPARSAEISPEISPATGPRAVTGYNLTLEGVFKAIPARVPTLQAVAGLWSTGADLVRLGLGWSSLLPGALAHEALTSQTDSGPGGGSGARVGLGWLINPSGDVATHAGANLDATAALTIRIRDGRTHVVLTSRMLPVNTIETRLLRAWTNPT